MVTNTLAYYATVKKVRAVAIMGTLLKAKKLKLFRSVLAVKV
jgi:hypothetical protein